MLPGPLRGHQAGRAFALAAVEAAMQSLRGSRAAPGRKARPGQLAYWKQRPLRPLAGRGPCRMGPGRSGGPPGVARVGLGLLEPGPAALGADPSSGWRPWQIPLASPAGQLALLRSRTPSPGGWREVCRHPGRVGCLQPWPGRSAIRPHAGRPWPVGPAGLASTAGACPRIETACWWRCEPFAAPTAPRWLKWRSTGCPGPTGRAELPRPAHRCQGAR